MKTVDKLLLRIASLFASSETLATGARLYRISNLRILTLNEFQGANSTLKVPDADRPPTGQGAIAPMYRTDANGRSTCAGYFAVQSTNGYVQRYYGGTYNGSGNGSSGIGATDKASGVAVWIIGGGTA